MAFHSILFLDPSAREKSLGRGHFLRDLNLDQIIAGITRGCNGGNLSRAFLAPLKCVDAVSYRQEVFRDLESDDVRSRIRAFVEALAEVQGYLHLAETLTFSIHQQGWFLYGADTYCDAIVDLVDDLAALPLRSRALAAFRDHVAGYAQSESFSSFLKATKEIRDDLSQVTYSLHIRDRHVEVRPFAGEPDLGAEVQRSFEKLSRGASRTYVSEESSNAGMSSLRKKIASCLSRLYPGVFARLDAFCERYADFPAADVVAFDREIQFYLAYLEYIGELRELGLSFCYPEVSTEGKEVHSCEGFDLALAKKLAAEGSVVVPNSFHLEAEERVLVLTGVNQGGKTTFARSFGQLHFLASIGCPVPGRKARLFLFDRILTHFEREESIQRLRGKMEDDLLRIRDILREATPNSIIIMNEVFTSATSHDGLILSKKMLDTIMELDVLGVCVTFIDELASVNEKIVSMVAPADPDDPEVRTYKIRRKPPEGLAHAASIAEKHRLTYEHLKERIK